MAADQERADRIRALKRDHPEFTWQAVAERVGVSLRAAQSWQETGGIAYENAKRLAELWGEDVDYIMRGERDRDGTPDPFAGASQLDRIERKLDMILAVFGAIPAPAEDAAMTDSLLDLLPEGLRPGDEVQRRAG